MKFERIDDEHSRAKVFGGWIVKSTQDVAHSTPDDYPVGHYDYGNDWRVSMVFVPDPKHEWVIEAVENGK